VPAIAKGIDMVAVASFIIEVVVVVLCIDELKVVFKQVRAEIKESHTRNRRLVGNLLRRMLPD